MLSMLRDGNAPETHVVQYFEIMGNRGDPPRGLDGGDEAPHPVGGRCAARVRRGRLELYGPYDWTQAQNLVEATANPPNLLSCNGSG